MLVFSGADYYPGWPSNDLVGNATILEEAIELLRAI